MTAPTPAAPLPACKLQVSLSLLGLLQLIDGMTVMTAHIPPGLEAKARLDLARRRRPLGRTQACYLGLICWPSSLGAWVFWSRNTWD